VKAHEARLDLDLLLKLRLVVARFGEMDAARWWNTGDSARRTAVLGTAGAVLMSRGFARTHNFAQARLVFEVARARCSQVFEPPESVTLWKLPAILEDQFDARWATWLEEREEWVSVFEMLQPAPTDLLDTMKAFGLIDAQGINAASTLRRSAEGRAVALPGVHNVSDELMTQLAAGFARGELGRLAVPYARLGS
jgi:hypothetical protein